MELRYKGLHRGRAGNTKHTGTGAPHWREVGAGARRVGWWSWSYRQAAASSMMESWCTCLWLFHAYDSFCLQEHQKRIYQVWYQKVRYSNGPFRSVSIFPFLSENGSDVVCILRRLLIECLVFRFPEVLLVMIRSAVVDMWKRLAWRWNCNTIATVPDRKSDDGWAQKIALHLLCSTT